MGRADARWQADRGIVSGPVRIAVAGALGRMGQAVVATAAGRTGVEVSARFDTPDAAGKGGLVSAEAALETCDVVIDFTTPAASTALARQAAERGAPALVIGATGFSAAEERVVRAAAKRIAIVKSGNFSLGLNVLIGLVRAGAATLPAHLYDIEIAETHHRRKIDAPSGTALMLGEAAAEGRGMDLSKVSVRGRDGIGGARADGQIGFASLRGGGVVGEHSVMFAAEDEILTLSHSARDRSLFARGAVEAALWAAGRAPGLYDMQDVLGFSKSE